MNMPPEYPAVKKTANKIAIDFVPAGCASQNPVEIPFVLDLDLYDEVIGIEALNFCSSGGPNILAWIPMPTF